jgi:hypothetical protein
VACLLHRIYYDLDLRYHSPDPADEDSTMRILTVMLAEDY